jgi:hypothetical protein
LKKATALDHDIEKIFTAEGIVVNLGDGIRPGEWLKTTKIHLNSLSVKLIETIHASERSFGSFRVHCIVRLMPNGVRN